MLQTVTSYVLVTILLAIGWFGGVLTPWISIPLCLLAIYFGYKAFDEKGNFYSLFAMFYAFCYILWTIIKLMI